MASRGLFIALVALLVLVANVKATKKCWKPDYWCNGGRDICVKGHWWRCPEDCRCGSGRCKPREPKCRGDLRNYDCIDSGSFCLGGKKMACAPGTWCGANRGNGSPCYITKRPRTCHNKHWSCVDSKSYCLNGHRVACPHGERCYGWGPCVKPLH